MKIAVRMDDITPDMDWENFRFFQELMESVNITPLLGIVPDNRDEKLSIDAPRQDFYEQMRKLQSRGYVLAMHGCCHLYTTKNSGMFPLNSYSEFAGRSYEKQKELLAHGKKKLEEHGIKTDIFMAPAHTYDKNTLKALKELGFTKMTDGFGRVPYRHQGMTFFPISFLLKKSLEQKSEGITTMVIHANTLTGQDKERYRKIFQKYGQNMVPYTTFFKMEPVKRSMSGRMGEYLLARSKSFLVKLRS